MKPNKVLLPLTLLILVATLHIVTPAVINLIIHGGFEERALNDDDEIFYLPAIRYASKLHTFKEGLLTPQANDQAVSSTPLNLITQNRPDGFIAYYLLGSLFNSESISLIYVALLLDIIAISSCAIFSYFTFLFLFEDRMIAGLTSLIAITNPITWYFAGVLNIPLPSSLYDLRSLGHSSPVTAEAVGPQLSMVLAYAGILLATKGILRPSCTNLCLSGLLIGLTIFCYFQTYLVFSLVIGLYILLYDFSSFKKIDSKQLASYCLSNLIVGVPGMIVASSTTKNNAMLVFRNSKFSEIAYFCPEEFLLVTMTLLLLMVLHQKRSLKLSLSLLLSLLITSLIVTNLDSLSGKFLASLQARPLFLQPIIWATIIGILISEAYMSRLTISWKRALLLGLTFVIGLSLTKRTVSASMVVVDEDGEKQLFLRKIASLPSSHFAAVPFDISKEIPTKVSRKVNLPSLIPLYSKSQVLIEHMGTKSILTASEFAERELLLST